MGSENAAAAAPKLPQPPYTPSAVPTSLGGNHSDTMRMPTTNPAPTTDSASRLNTSVETELESAKIVFGIDGEHQDRGVHPAGPPTVERHADEDARRNGERHVAQRDRLLLRVGQAELVGDRVGERCVVEPHDEAQEERDPREMQDPVLAGERPEAPNALQRRRRRRSDGHWGVGIAHGDRSNPIAVAS